MDLMYILGTGSTNDNFELRHALRSVAQHLKGLGRVFVVGANPGFLSDEVVFIPCVDPYKQKHKNMLYKIQYCATHTNISDKFLVSSDDIFLMKDMNCQDIPCYHRGKLLDRVTPEALKNEKSYEYNLFFTYNVLKRRDLPTYQFAIHTLHVVDKSIFRRHSDLINSMYDLRLGVEPFCLINNVMLNDDPNLPIEKMTDYKIIYSDGHDDFCMKTRRIPFFSCNDEALENGGMEVIQEYWSKKSKWEK